MHISRISISNFRLLKNSGLDLRPNISLLVGKNNTGKTSLLVVLEKFFTRKRNFHYYDFPISLRARLKDLQNETDVEDLSIRLLLDIEYDENDSLEDISEFILDLDENINRVQILFECRIDLESIKQALDGKNESECEKYLLKEIGKHLKHEIYAVDSSTFEFSTEPVSYTHLTLPTTPYV